VALEILHFTLVLFGGFAIVESAEIAALAGIGIDFSRIEAVLARFEFADHGVSPFVRTNAMPALAFLAEIALFEVGLEHIGVERLAGGAGDQSGGGIA
jgi:hypothetical protein